MKQKHLLYGVIAGLGVLLYFKFGKNKVKELAEGGNGGATGGGATVGGGTGVPTTGGVKPPKNENCGNFTVYYKDVQNDFKWNNGKPQVTKTKLPPYPMANVRMASGDYHNLTVIEGYFAPQTKAVTMAEYTKACADKKSGKFDTPQMSGGAPPNGGGSPIGGGGLIETIQYPLNSKPKPNYTKPYITGAPELESFVRATGDYNGDIMDAVIN